MIRAKSNLEKWKIAPLCQFVCEQPLELLGKVYASELLSVKRSFWNFTEKNSYGTEHKYHFLPVPSSYSAKLRLISWEMTDIASHKNANAFFLWDFLLHLFPHILILCGQQQAGDWNSLVSHQMANADSCVHKKRFHSVRVFWFW